MIRYLKMYRSFVGNCLIREMEFRWHFILYSLINLIWMVLALMTFVFIYGHVSLIGSWTLPQMLLLTATFYFFDRVFDTLFEINFSRLNHMVNQGELDLVLTKPVSGQFLVSLRYFSFASLFGAISMLGLIIWLIARYFWPLAPGELLIYALLLCFGLVIIYSWWFSTLLLVFWLGNIDNIHQLFRPIYEVVRIPIDITGPILKPLLTFVIPLAFVATVPVQVFTRGANYYMLLYGLVVAAASLWLSHRLWLFALKHYTSASS